MKTVSEFILKSRKIYAILGVGIMLCVCVLTANISYNFGKTKATGYSEEYLETYGAIVWEYTIAGTDPTEATLSGALTKAKDMCELLYNTTDEQKTENVQKNWETLKANLAFGN